MHLLAHLGAFLSVSDRLFSFSLERLDGLNYWSRYWWCSVDCRRSCRRLVRVVIVERADELSKILDR